MIDLQAREKILFRKKSVVVLDGEQVGFTVKVVRRGHEDTAGAGPFGRVLRRLKRFPFGFGEGRGPNGGSVVEERATNSLVRDKQGLLVTTPGGPGDCPKDVVTFTQLVFDVVSVLAKVEHCVEGDTENFWVVGGREDGVVYRDAKSGAVFSRKRCEDGGRGLGDGE